MDLSGLDWLDCMNGLTDQLSACLRSSGGRSMLGGLGLNRLPRVEGRQFENGGEAPEVDLLCWIRPNPARPHFQSEISQRRKQIFSGSPSYETVICCFKNVVPNSLPVCCWPYRQSCCELTGLLCSQLRRQFF